MKALTAAEMREVDRLTTERYGIPSLQLMEAAGQSVADVIHEFFLATRQERPRRVAVLCGKGNNGGDGFVAARHLQNTTLPAQVQVYLFGPPDELRGDAQSNYKRWSEGGGTVTEIKDEPAWERVSADITRSEVVVDALLGTGLRGPATGIVARAIEDLNRFSRNATSALPAFIVAVDTPSGLPSDGEVTQGPVLRAHATVTFTAPKFGQLLSADASCCGDLLVRTIGSPAALVEEVGKGTLRWAGPEEFATLPLIRAVNSHKGTFGHVLIVAGSLGKSGAAVLCGLASLRAGAGLTTIATPDMVLPMVAAAEAEYMTEPLDSTASGNVAAVNVSSGRFSAILAGKTVLALGPGLGTNEETQQFVREVVHQASLPLILDADGLNAFSGKLDRLLARNSRLLAITPHPGEMARLLGTTGAAVQADRLNIATEVARHWNVHVILKGFHTILAAPDGAAWVNTTGNAGLAKGGTGDVLTGVLAALTAQFGTKDWLRVLALGVYLHGAAAAFPGRWSDASGLLASSVALGIPMMRQALIREIRRRA